MALMLPMVVGADRRNRSDQPARSLAAIVAGVVGWFTRNTLTTMVAGMATLWLLQSAVT